MADTGPRLDPVGTFRFQVRFDNVPPGGFSDCTGISLETEVYEYHEGGVNTHVWKFATRTKQANVTLKRGIVDGVMWSWYQSIVSGDMQFRNGTIAVLDPAGREPAIEFQLVQAFPVKWVGPDLSAGQNLIAVETIELAHQGIGRTR